MHHDMTAADLGVVHFSEPEMRGWWFEIDPSWILRADLLREYAGLVIHVSPVEGAIGRRKGKDDTSDHNIDYWGRVYGLDVLPLYLTPGRDSGTIRDQAFNFMRIATQVGFTAIGYYPDWKNISGEPNPGFHLGTRRNRRPGNPATWGGLRKKKDKGSRYDYIALIDAINQTSERIA